VPTLSDRIRQVRRSASLSQADLARQIGVARSAVAQWEGRNGSRPTTQNMAKIALVTSVNFEWLATGRGGRWQDFEAAPASNLDRFAQDELEERLLVGFRRIGDRERRPLVEFIEKVAVRE
jgi:transcriptional regulator with XRE-family HTH domain